MLYTFYCILCGAYYILHTACSILSTAYCVVHTVYRILHTACSILSTVYCILCSAYSIMSTAYSILHIVYCLLRTAYCILSTVYCTVHTLYCTLLYPPLPCTRPFLCFEDQIGSTLYLMNRFLHHRKHKVFELQIPSENAVGGNKIAVRYDVLQ